MRSRFAVAVGSWCVSLVLLAGVETRALAEQIIFTIDPNVSTWNTSGSDNTYGTFQEQSTGSLSAPVSGHFLVQFDPTTSTPATLQFVGGHGYFEVDSPHLAVPGVGGVGPAAPANGAGQTALGEVSYAIRDLVWDFTSPAIPRTGGVYPGTQSSFIVLSGGADASFPSGASTTSYVGASELLTAGDWVLMQPAPGSWTLSISGYYDYTYSGNVGGVPVSGNLRSAGDVISTAQFGANNVDAVAPAQTQAQALGGSSVVGGVSANLSPTNTGGTFSVQQVPNQTGLPQAAVIAAQANPIFALSTAALSTDPQIWNVDFSGDLGGTIELVFAYDESLLPAGTDESTLGIWHFNSNTGQWDFGGTVDSVANTVTFTTDNLSPFELGVAVVPEPCTLALAAIGLVGLPAFGWRRRKR